MFVNYCGLNRNWISCQVGELQILSNQRRILGRIKSKNNICMVPFKVQTIVDWPPQPMFVMFNVFLDSPTFINVLL